MKERHKITVASYIILIRDNQVLMMRRKDTGYQDGNYGLPSGHIENGEFPDEAIIREAKEEVGVKVKDLKFVTILYTSYNYGCFFFASNSWDGEIRNCEEEKCDDISWFDLDKLPDNIAPEVKVGLENYLKKMYYSNLET